MGSTSAPGKRPNFLVIVADDLGYSDLGAYGSEIETPNLDKLAKEGIRMSNFHTASACSPTRSMLMSGTDNHIAGLGQMVEYMSAFPDTFKDVPGYEGYLNKRVAALPEILQEAGYLNIMSGKWHLGLTKEFVPASRGFEKVFSFLHGSGNHHAYEPQLSGIANKISCLNTDGHWMEGDKFLDRETELPENFFSTKTFTDKMIGYLADRTPQEKEKPFFSYLAYTAPHWPLQAKRETIEKYAGKYDDGPDALTQRRLANLKKLGLVPQEAECPPPTGNLNKSWAEMNDEEKTISARKMEAFAAMVDEIDQNVGRVLEHLRETGELDNTFVLFMSDNGAEGAALEALPLMGGPDTMASIIETYYNNSLENIGNKDSFVWYGPRWACAASAPSRGFKCWITEGGIRCPCIVRYPAFTTAAGAGAAARGENAISHAFATVMDILPTVLDLAGVPHPGRNFQGREVALPRGKTWAGHLGSGRPLDETDVHGDETHIHGWELFGQRAIRKGKWKAMWQTAPRGKEDWELYDMDNDRAELHDLSEKEPEVLKELVLHWETYFAETGMIQTPRFAMA